MREKSFEPTQFPPARGYSKEDWDEVSGNPVLTSEEFARAKPFAEALRHMAESITGDRQTPNSWNGTACFQQG